MSENYSILNKKSQYFSSTISFLSVTSLFPPLPIASTRAGTEAVLVNETAEWNHRVLICIPISSTSQQFCNYQ